MTFFAFVIALGTVIAETLGILALCGHFFRKVNTFRPVRHFSLTDSYYVFRASFGGKPVRMMSAQMFDDWATALERYNSRTVKTASGKKYCEEADKRNRLEVLKIWQQYCVNELLTLLLACLWYNT